MNYINRLGLSRKLATFLAVACLLVLGSFFNPQPTGATDLPVIQKSGTLATNETWSAGSVYMVTGTLTVPDALTLTIEPGAVVKYTSYYQAKIQVNTGGTLNATGVSGNPVYFTSYKDDSLGGDSNGDGSSSGSLGDYTRAVYGNGGSVGLAYTEFKYGSMGLDLNDVDLTAEDLIINTVDEGITLDGGLANLRNTTIANASVGLDIEGSAEVAYRGTFDDISDKAIEACDWDEDCAVDAAYVDWGSADGPLPSGGDPLVCGQVVVSPWTHSSTNYDGEMYTSQNCDGSPLPSASLSNNAASFSQAVATKQIDCSNGFQDACDAIDTAFACLGGAMSVAQSQIPWPLPPATTEQEVQAFAAGTVSAASTYLTSEATQSVTGFSFGLLGKVAGAVSTISTMASAYSSCAP